MNGVYRMSGWSCVLLLAALAWAPPAPAQPPRDADRDMTPIWTLQAQSMAKELGLNDELTQKVVDAYLASRKDLASAIEQATGEGRARFAAMMKAAEVERTDLEEALRGTLTAEQLEKAVNALGAFGRQTDRMIAAIQDMKLDDDQQQKALVMINEYSADISAMRENASTRDDWQGLRAAMQEAKSKLDTNIATVLSESQLATWNQETAWRGRGRGPGRDGGGQGRAERGRDSGESQEESDGEQ